MSASLPTAIDLYAGAGGATQGLLDAGYQVIAAVENDVHAVASFAENHKHVRLFSQDIQWLDADAVRTSLGLARGDLTLVTACPPCQGWSSLGKGDALDPRNNLVNDVWRFIDAFSPRAFLLENVPGLGADARLTALKARAKRGGYAVQTYHLDARDLGVPQRRRRLIVVGVPRRLADYLPSDLRTLVPASFDTSARNIDEIFKTTSRLTEAADPVHRFRRLTPRVLQRVEKIPKGGDRFDLPPELQLECHAKLERTRSATASYGRIRAGEPAPTMTTRCTTPACGRFLHPTEPRGISLREAALIQTFPPAYQFKGTYGDIERQIGNAVPVRMAEALGRAVCSILESP